MNIDFTSTGIIADGSTNANEVDFTSVNTALTNSGTGLADRVNLYGAWMGSSFGVDTNNNITVSNYPSEFTQQSAINVMKLLSSKFATGTQSITITLKAEFTSQRAILDSYQLVLAWNSTGSVYEITPLSYDLVADTPIAVA